MLNAIIHFFKAQFSEHGTQTLVLFFFLNSSKHRMGKTRNLFKKNRYPKGTFHAKMGTIKDRNGMGLTEAENVKKRWQEYTEEYTKRSSQSR